MSTIKFHLLLHCGTSFMKKIQGELIAGELIDIESTFINTYTIAKIL